jgi:transposase
VRGGVVCHLTRGAHRGLALLDSFAFAIGRVGVEGSAGLGRHVTQALVAAGYDVREVQANRTAERRRRRRRHKTDREDAEAIARETLADPDLPPAGKQRGPDPAWEELVAVRNRRKSLISQRVRLLNEAEAVLTSLPLPVRAALPQTSRVRPRLRALQQGLASSVQLGAADRVNLAWLTETAADITRLDARVTELDKKILPLLGRLGSTLTHQHGIAAVGAMDLLVEVGDPPAFATEAQLGPLVRGSAGGGVLRRGRPGAHPPPTRPGRQPAGELHLAPDAHHPDPRLSTRPRLRRPQARRAQDQAGNPPRPQTAPRQRRHRPHVGRPRPTTRDCCSTLASAAA